MLQSSDLSEMLLYNNVDFKLNNTFSLKKLKARIKKFNQHKQIQVYNNIICNLRKLKLFKNVIQKL